MTRPDLFTVYVDGTEVVDYIITRTEAENIAEHYTEQGYDNVQVYDLFSQEVAQ